MSEIIRDVTDTALWVATYRAEETRRPDALFSDPLAEVLAGERGREIARKMKRSRHTEWNVVIRTCIIDAFIRSLCAADVPEDRKVDTVINLGAGLDTRPYRMDLPPGLRWVEVDFPGIIALKNERLAAHTPHVALERVSLDLSHREERRRLLESITARSRRVLVLTEGVLPYLSNEQVSELAEDLFALPKIEHWIVDYISPQVYRYILSSQRKMQMKNAPFLFLPADWFEFFESRHWKPKELRYIGEESIRLNRRFPAPWWMRPLMALAPRKKTEAFLRMSGYALLERGTR